MGKGRGEILFLFSFPPELKRPTNVVGVEDVNREVWGDGGRKKGEGKMEKS